MQNKNKNEQRMFLKICSAAGKYKCGAKVPCKRKLFTLRRIHNNCSRRAWTNENQPPFQCHSYRCTLLRFCKQRHVALLLFLRHRQSVALPCVRVWVLFCFVFTSFVFCNGGFCESEWVCVCAKCLVRIECVVWWCCWLLPTHNRTHLH